MSDDHAARKTTVRRTGEEPAKDWPGADFAQLRPRIHALVHDLMRGVLAAFVAASPAEIGELMQTAGQNREGAAAPWRLNRAPRAVRGGSTAAPSTLDGLSPAPAARDAELESHERLKRNAGKRAGIRRAASFGATRTMARGDHASPEARPPLGSHDPFDITSPSELLASSDGPTPSVEAPSRSASSTERAGSEGGETATAPDSATPKASQSLLEPPPPRGSTATPVVAIDPDASSERRPRVVLREGERLLSATGSGVVIRRARR